MTIIELFFELTLFWQIVTVGMCLFMGLAAFSLIALPIGMYLNDRTRDQWIKVSRKRTSSKD